MRNDMGLSQTELAALSKVSLPTIQNIEAGKANPSLSVVKSLSDALGLEVKVKLSEPDWDLLVNCGLPLISEKKRAQGAPNADMLAQLIRKACVFTLQAGQIDRRKKEALQALLLAIQTHYPTYFKLSFRKCSAVQDVFPKKITGRIIKLKRIALSHISQYL
jgi:transcriptional regulator with XRE-family HTH domain